MPSRWELGAARLVNLQLRNCADMELSHLRLRACWPETGGAQESWRDLPPLRPDSSPFQVDLRLSPAHKGEDVLQFQIQARMGDGLDVELGCCKSGQKWANDSGAT